MNNEDATKSSKPRGGIKRLFLYGFLFLVIYVIAMVVKFFFLPARLEIGPETTVISEPLREDGTIDYVKAIDELHANGVTSKNNACVLLVQALGPDVYGDNKTKALKRLGIPNLAVDGDYLLILSDYLIEQGVNADIAEMISNDDYMETIEKPWAPDDHPEIANWLKDYNEQVEMFVQASQKSQYYSPLMTQGPDDLAITVLLPMMQELRGVARMLSCRAMLHCESGDAEGAMNDAMAIIRLSRLCDDHPFLIGRLVSYALGAIGSQAVHEILITNQLNSEQIQKLAKEYEALPEIRSIIETFEKGERYTSLDAALSYYRGTASNEFGLPGSNPVFNGIDINVVMRLFNQRYDDIVEATRTLNREERIQFEAEYLREVKSKGKLSLPAILSPLLGSNQGISEALGNNLYALLLPAFSQAINAEERIRVRASLIPVLFALADYRAVHGTYPANLDELAPEHLTAIPNDIYGNGPIQYSLNEVGNFLIYSIGVNGIDDGGVMEPATDKDDIAYGWIPVQVESE